MGIEGDSFHGYDPNIDPHREKPVAPEEPKPPETPAVDVAPAPLMAVPTPTTGKGGLPLSKVQIRAAEAKKKKKAAKPGARAVAAVKRVAKKDVAKVKAAAKKLSAKAKKR